MRRAEAARLRASAVVVATVASAWVSTVARAQTAEPIELELDVAAGCPSKDDVLDRIRALSVAWPPRGVPLRAALAIARADNGRFHMHLVVRAGDSIGERTLDGKTCKTLADAAAVHLALLLNGEDPNRARSVLVTPPPGRVLPEAQPEPQAAERSVARADARSRSERDDPFMKTHDGALRVAVQVPRASIQLGPFPRPSFGTSLAGGLMIAQWRLIAAAHVWLQQRVSHDAEPRSRAAVDRIEANFRFCRAITRGVLEFAPCATVSLEHVWAEGAGADIAPRTAKATWVAAGVGLQSRLSLASSWALVADIDAQLEGARPDIVIEGLGRVDKLGPVAFSLTVGSEWIP